MPVRQHTGQQSKAPARASKYSVVSSAAKRHGVPPWLLWGIFGAESTYGTNGSNYFGLIESEYRMANGNVRRPQNTANLAESADISAELLASLKQEHGTWAAAVAQYAPYSISHPRALSRGGKQEASELVDIETPLGNIPFPGPNINPNPLHSLGIEQAGEALGIETPSITNPFGGISEIASDLKGMFSLLFTPEGWLQIGQVFAGVILIGWGTHQLIKVSTGTNVVRKSTGLGVKAAEIAAVVK